VCNKSEAEARLLAVIELDFRAILRGYNVPRVDAIALCAELRTQVEKYFTESKRTVRVVKFSPNEGIGSKCFRPPGSTTPRG
jgi:hypothetical protein